MSAVQQNKPVEPKRLIGWLQLSLFGCFWALLGLTILSNARAIENTIQHFVVNGTPDGAIVESCPPRKIKRHCYGTMTSVSATSNNVLIEYGSCDLRGLTHLKGKRFTPVLVTSDQIAMPAECAKPPSGRVFAGQFFMSAGGMLFILGIWGYFRDVPKTPNPTNEQSRDSKT